MLKVKADLKAELLKPRYRDAFGPALSAVLIEQGLAAQLCNSLYEQEKKLERELAAEGAQLGRSLARPPAASSLRASSSPLPEPEPTREELSVVSAIRDRWAAQLHATLLHHCEQTGQPLMRVNRDGESGGGGRQKDKGCKCLFSTDDLIMLLELTPHPNLAKARSGARSWCLTPLELSTSKLPQLRERFAELAPSVRQSGLDDELRGWFAEERNAVGRRLLSIGYAPLLVQFARQGVPAGLRARVWLAALRVGTVTERDYLYFGALQREIHRVTLATDDMVRQELLRSWPREGLLMAS